MRGNPARPAPGAVLASVDIAPEGGAVAVDFISGDARFSLILARRNNAFYAYENRCPHASYPLERPDGRVVVQQARYIVCTAHGASFDLETGACVGGPCIGESLKAIPIIVEDGAVRMR